MSNLVSLTQVSLAFGLDKLLDNVNLQINSGERAALIGRNGSGKSSLLKIVEGSVAPDAGNVWRKPNLRMARLTQELPKSPTTVFEFVAEGLAQSGELLIAYHALIENMGAAPSPGQIKELEALQHKLEVKGGWHYHQEMDTILSRLELDPEKPLSALSGGWQRRAALARALVTQPELLLLDEPTNHLDIEAIEWLENFLLNSNIALVFITHDRSFLQKLATRIIELDRGRLSTWPEDYNQFLVHKDELLHAEAKAHADFDKKLAQEEQWIRQGIKARRTRNEGRVRALEAMRFERSKRREVQGNVKLQLNTALSSGQLVVEAEHINHSYGDQRIIKDFSIRIMRGDRIGLIGPNGIGKSTLLHILLGKMQPQQGLVTLGTNLKIAYFDQQRAALDLEKTVADNVTQGSDTIEINNQKRHIISYLGDFLFSPQRALTPVKALSGGECNRLLLARLFSVPNNVLVMDEPTNDLDIETLELLEELLCEYQGTLLLVSHDREFLNNVITSTLVFEGNGKIQENVGGYKDWVNQQAVVESKGKKILTQEAPVKKSKTAQKLSYKEQQELSGLPRKIESLEAEQQRWQDQLAEPGFYQQAHEKVTMHMNRLKAIEVELQRAYERWDELENRK